MAGDCQGLSCVANAGAYGGSSSRNAFASRVALACAAAASALALAGPLCEMGRVPAAVWGNEDGSFEVICFRSVAQYVFDVLKVSAQPGGEVGFH